LKRCQRKKNCFFRFNFSRIKGVTGPKNRELVFMIIFLSSQSGVKIRRWSKRKISVKKNLYFIFSKNISRKSYEEFFFRFLIKFCSLKPENQVSQKTFKPVEQELLNITPQKFCVRKFWKNRRKPWKQYDIQFPLKKRFNFILLIFFCKS